MTAVLILAHLFSSLLFHKSRRFRLFRSSSTSTAGTAKPTRMPQSWMSAERTNLSRHSFSSLLNTKKILGLWQRCDGMLDGRCDAVVPSVQQFRLLSSVPATHSLIVTRDSRPPFNNRFHCTAVWTCLQEPGCHVRALRAHS